MAGSVEGFQNALAQDGGTLGKFTLGEVAVVLTGEAGRDS